jgi:hypothetical protein
MAVSGPDVTGALAGEAQFDYVFSEAELEDVLMFMERQQDDKAATTANAFLNNTPPASVSLQFQPHPSGGFLGNPYTSLGLDQGLNGAQPYLAQIDTDVFVSQSMGHHDVMPFDLGVQLEPDLNPGHLGSRTLDPQPGIGSEPLPALDGDGMNGCLDLSQDASPNPATSLGQASSSSLRPQPQQLAPQVKQEPLTAAFAKLGSGGLSTPSPKPQQFSAELTSGQAAFMKKGWSICGFHPVLLARPSQLRCSILLRTINFLIHDANKS